MGSHIESRINNLKVNRTRRFKINELRATAQRVNRPKHPGKHALYAMAALAMSSKLGTHAQQLATFDTDSKPIGVDNRCSACISHDVNDFVSDLQPCNRSIKGFGGTRHTHIMKGTIQWRWCDDEGVVHKFNIPNSYYVPAAKQRLMSPQHWAKSQKDKTKQGTGEFTGRNECVLYWNRRQNKLTIPLSLNTNVATFAQAPGYDKFSLFCQEAKVSGWVEKDILIANPAGVVSDDEDIPEETPVKQTGSDYKQWQTSEPSPCDFNIDGPQNRGKGRTVSPPKTMSDATIDLLKLHHRLGHIPFAKLKILAKEGALPKQYAKCETPVCTSCTYSTMTKRKWRSRTRHDHKPISKPLAPGEMVSVDQLVSPTAGFVAQMTGILTLQRYKYATVYVDQASRLGYTYLQKSATAEETIKGKIAFELYARSHGVKVQGYHADNGIFRANAWINHCNSRDQTMTFAGVNAHHQNGIAERRIRTLQNMARTMLIHSAYRWPACITANLWPYALRMANESLNNCPSMQDSKYRSPMQIFSKSKVMMNPKHFQTFGCPVYVLDNKLQHNAPFHKWKERSRVGIYLGQSPVHGKNVALVLNRQTGLVSPQFHVKFDPSFHSVMQDQFDSKWQERAGFTKIKQENQTAATQQKGPKRRTTRNSNKTPLVDSPVIPHSEGGMRSSEGADEDPFQTEREMPDSEGAEQNVVQPITPEGI